MAPSATPRLGLGAEADRDSTVKSLGSSFGYISSKAPQTLLLVAEDDQLIPPAGAYQFYDAAKAAGVSIELVKLPYLNHGFADAGTYDSLPDQGSLTITENYLTTHVLS